MHHFSHSEGVSNQASSGPGSDSVRLFTRVNQHVGRKLLGVTHSVAFAIMTEHLLLVNHQQRIYLSSATTNTQQNLCEHLLWFLRIRLIAKTGGCHDQGRTTQKCLSFPPLCVKIPRASKFYMTPLCKSFTYACSDLCRQSFKQVQIWIIRRQSLKNRVVRFVLPSHTGSGTPRRASGSL